MTSLAQDTDRETLYGSGVHAYFNQQYDFALQSLNEVVDLGTRDPRVYYFRGLTQMQLGNVPAAVRNVEKGAELEFSSTGRFYPVSEALMRIQGPWRIQIEEMRTAARVWTAHQPAPPLRTPDGQALAVPILSRGRTSADQKQLDLPVVAGPVDPSTPFEAGDPIVMEQRAPVEVSPLPTTETQNPFDTGDGQNAPPSQPPAQPGRNPFDTTTPKKDDGR